MLYLFNNDINSIYLILLTYCLTLILKDFLGKTFSLWSIHWSTLRCKKTQCCLLFEWMDIFKFFKKILAMRIFSGATQFWTFTHPNNPNGNIKMYAQTSLQAFTPIVVAQNAKFRSGRHNFCAISSSLGAFNF